MKRNKKNRIIILLLCSLCMFSCADSKTGGKEPLSNMFKANRMKQNGKTSSREQALSYTHEMRIITKEELCNPNKDTILLWENGGFLGRQKGSRNYRLILSNCLHKDYLSAREIEILYPASVEEMNWFYSQLTSKDKYINLKMRKIDSLMTLFADLDTLSCLPRFLNMYLLMDPRIINRDWMGDWNLNRAMYCVIPDNKQSFRSYYDTLDTKYEWVIREWCYAYRNF